MHKEDAIYKHQKNMHPAKENLQFLLAHLGDLVLRALGVCNIPCECKVYIRHPLKPGSRSIITIRGFTVWIGQPWMNTL
jgi:hypothetical protein